MGNNFKTYCKYNFKVSLNAKKKPKNKQTPYKKGFIGKNIKLTL